VKYLIERNWANVGTGQWNTVRLFSLCGSEHRRDGYTAAITPTTSLSHFCSRVIVPALRFVMSLGEFSLPGEDRAEQEMLNDWQFPQDFCEVHLDHSLVHLVPGLDLRMGVS